jgi:hypothetical protein
MAHLSRLVGRDMAANAGASTLVLAIEFGKAGGGNHIEFDRVELG